MLNSIYLVDRNKVLDDEIDQFQFLYDGSVLLFELLTLLNHKLLYIVVLLIGQLKLTIQLFKLGPSMFHLLLKR
jgi:hypothetical protein